MLEINNENNKKSVMSINSGRRVLDCKDRDELAKKILTILGEEELSYWQAKTILNESIALLEVECVLSI